MNINTFLMVNLARVVEGTCNACGDQFAAKASGDKALTLPMGDKSQPLLFCSSCGDNIMSHLKGDQSGAHYGWDWVIPLRNGNGSDGAPRE
jgi:hypothetical protein